MGFTEGFAIGQRAGAVSIDAKLQRERQDMLRNQFVMERQMKQAQMDMRQRSSDALLRVSLGVQTATQNKTLTPSTASDLILQEWSEIQLDPSGPAKATAITKIMEEGTAHRDMLAAKARRSEKAKALQEAGVAINMTAMRDNEIEALYASMDHVEAWKNAYMGALPMKDDKGRKVVDIDKLRDSYQENLNAAAVSKQTAENAATAIAAEKEPMPDDLIPSTTSPDRWYSPSRGTYYIKAKDDKGGYIWSQDVAAGRAGGPPAVATPKPTGQSIWDRIKAATTAP